MRLVRFPGRPAKVSDDVRAALASLGAGGDVAGGVALVGVRPPGLDRDVDAVLVLPRGVLIVVGVDLPDPAVRLEAPLHTTWKVDGWPLVRTDDVVNPATEALALSEKVAELARAVESDVVVGTIIAVGPFAETVEQPPSELSGPVHVVHPTATSMLAAAVSLARAKEDLAVDRARALLDNLAPTPCGFDDDALVQEGFASRGHHLAAPSRTVPIVHPDKIDKTGGTGPAATAAVTTITPPSAPPAPARAAQPPTHPATPAPPAGPPPSTRGGRSRRRLGALAVAGALALAVAVTVTIVAVSGGEPTEQSDARATPVVSVEGIAFAEHASGSDSECARHALGELQVFLDTSGCTRVWRGSYQARVAGKPVAVSVAALTFAGDTEATAFHTLAETPGSGVLIDLAAERGRWPGQPPSFENSAYASRLRGRTVLLVLACSRTGQSTPDDPALVEAAQAALRLPRQG